jgi:hypothetical protein
VFYSFFGGRQKNLKKFFFEKKTSSENISTGWISDFELFLTTDCTEKHGSICVDLYSPPCGLSNHSLNDFSSPPCGLSKHPLDVSSPPSGFYMYLDVPFCMGIYAPFAGVKKGSVNLSIAAGGEHKPPACGITPPLGVSVA